MMEQEKFNKVLLILVIVAIAVSVLGTLLVLNASDFERLEVDESYDTSGSISLSIQGPPQTDGATGSIELDVVDEQI